VARYIWNVGLDSPNIPLAVYHDVELGLRLINSKQIETNIARLLLQYSNSTQSKMPQTSKSSPHTLSVWELAKPSMLEVSARTRSSISCVGDLTLSCSIYVILPGLLESRLTLFLT